MKSFLPLRSAAGRARGILWSLRSRRIVVARGAKVGRRCRMITEPGSRIVVGRGCEIDDGCTLAAYGGGTIDLGTRSFLGHHCTIAARDHVELGAGAFLAELVSVRDHDHDPAFPPSSGKVLVQAVTIGPDAWLGSKVTVLRGCTIGAGAVIGANAVANRSVPDGALAVGVPAKVISQVEGTNDSPRSDGR